MRKIQFSLSILFVFVLLISVTGTVNAAKPNAALQAKWTVMVYISGGENLTVWNTKAPDKTMYYLLIALIVGILLIFPAFAYLFKVFKFRDEGHGTRD